MTIDRKMLALIGGAAIIALVGGGAGYVLRGDAAHSDEAAQGVETGGDAEAEAAPGEGTIMVTEAQLRTARDRGCGSRRRLCRGRSDNGGRARAADTVGGSCHRTHIGRCRADLAPAWRPGRGR